MHVARLDDRRYAVIIDQHGKLHWEQPHTNGSPIVRVLDRAVPDGHLAELAADGISYIVSDGDDIDLEQTLVRLASRFGVRRLLLLGGARTNAAFIEAQLVDEVSLVLFPAFGARSGSRTLFEAGPDGLARSVRLAMTATEMRRGGAVHLRYAVTYR